MLSPKISDREPASFLIPKDSQRPSYFVIARARSHRVEKSTSPDFTPLDPEKDLNFLGRTGSHCSYSSSSSFLSWREVYTYILLPWFQGILSFLILHETSPNPNHKISQWKIHKNWQVTQGTTNIVTFACCENEGSKRWHILSPKK